MSDSNRMFFVESELILLTKPPSRWCSLFQYPSARSSAWLLPNIVSTMYQAMSMIFVVVVQVFVDWDGYHHQFLPVLWPKGGPCLTSDRKKGFKQ